MWQIDYQCPQCSAPVVLSETDRLFLCPFCRVKLYITSGGCFRYFLPPQNISSKDMIFIPYWRFRGIVYSCRPYEIIHRVVDASCLATNHTFLPPSLGMRPQALKLRFITPEMDARFFKPQLQAKEIVSRIERPLMISAAMYTSNTEDANDNKISMEDPFANGHIFYKDFIGETISIIYAPFFIKGIDLYDAILNRPVARLDENSIENGIDSHIDWRVKFLSTLCPHCGWDLEGEKNSIVLFCKNCESLWDTSNNVFHRLDFGVMHGDGKELYYLPFWKMKVDIEGIVLKSYADMIKMANIPKVIKKEWHERDIYFWSPAFKMPPDVFLRLARQATVYQPEDGSERMVFSSAGHVTLPLNEALETVKFTLANIAVDKKGIYPKLGDIDIKLKEYSLIYIPFVAKGSELIQPEMQFSIHKNALKTGRNL
jgi:DNA-directed RNA polymerase subunit RPC12/RpoP